MKAVTKWNFRPYSELSNIQRSSSPYICRIAPRKGAFTVDIIDNGAAGLTDDSHIIYWRCRGDGEWNTVYPKIKGDILTVTINCEDECDYEVYAVRCKDGTSSSVRLVRTGYVPGNVINYLHPEDPEYGFSGNYLCSPSLVKLPDGTLLASMDIFAANRPQNLTLIYRSTDGGINWEYLTELFPCFWGKMFIADDKLYMLGVSREYGDLLIGRSDDGGRNWTAPTVLFRGANFSGDNGVHRAPMPVLISHGRVMTDMQYGSWSRHIYKDAVISAPEHSDLLDARNWVSSGLWYPDDAPESKIDGIVGGIEGTVVESPEGKIYDFLRYADGKWLLLEYDPENPENDLKYAGLIDFPATTSKADILRDKKTGLYFSLVSYRLNEPRTVRNLLSLVCSDNLRDWRLVKHIIDYRYADPSEVAFQYVDFQFDGDDIIFQSRTAFNKANNFHNNNYSTFGRIENFRDLL